MHTHATHTYILHGEFLFIQLHSIRCNTVWQPLGRPVTSVVVVADGCLSCMFVCVCVFICIVFFWQRRRTALLCSNSPLCTPHIHIPMRTTARTHTYTHAHTELLLLCYSVVVVAVGAAVVFISFRRNGRCQNEFERASERLC